MNTVMDSLKLLLVPSFEAFGFWLWIISALVGIAVFIHHLTKKNGDELLELALQTVGQWWIAYSILMHKGFDHGWVIHMVTERTVFGYLILAVANMFMFLRMYKKNGK